MIKYLCEIETEFETTVACFSGAQMGSNHKKWRSKISWHTPLKENFFYIKSRSLSRRQLQDLNSRSQLQKFYLRASSKSSISRSQLQKLHLGSSSKSSISGSQLKDLNISEPAQGIPLAQNISLYESRIFLTHWESTYRIIWRVHVISIKKLRHLYLETCVFFVRKPCSLHLETLFTHIKTYYH